MNGDGDHGAHLLLKGFSYYRRKAPFRIEPIGENRHQVVSVLTGERLGLAEKKNEEDEDGTTTWFQTGDGSLACDNQEKIQRPSLWSIARAIHLRVLPVPTIIWYAVRALVLTADSLFAAAKPLAVILLIAVAIWSLGDLKDMKDSLAYTVTYKWLESPREKPAKLPAE